MICDICVNGKVPRKNNVMNFLYIGAASCMQYWIAGRRGQIPPQMCDVVKFLAMTTCGCEEPMNPTLQAMAVDMLNGKTVEGREPIKLPKSSNQLISEAAFADYNNNRQPMN